jgi:hypothetical protein
MERGVILDSITLLLGAIGAVLALLSEAVRDRKITRHGWISIILLILAFITGVWSRIDSGVAQQSLSTKLTNSESELKQVRSENAKLTEKIEGVQRGVDAVHSQTTVIFTKQLANEARTADAQLEALVIRQVVQDNPPKEAGDKNNKTITFYVDVKDSSVDKRELFSRIKRVTYYFDQRWFSDKPVVAVDNISEDFRYSIGAWGPTRFHAEITTADPERRLLRGGIISTTENKTFE